MMSSKRFRASGLHAALAAVCLQASGFAADVGWSDASSPAAAAIWTNDASGASTLGEGMLQLNAPSGTLVLSDPSAAVGAGLMALTGTASAPRTSVTTGALAATSTLGSGDWQADEATRMAVNALLADVGTDVSQVTKTAKGTLLLSDASTYSGATTLSDGSLSTDGSRSFVAGASGLAGGSMASSDLGTVPSKTFVNSAAVGGSMTFADTLNPSGAGFSSGIDLQGAVRTFTTGANVTFDGVIADGSVIKTGAAALTLTGINTYAGGTTLTEGTLFAANNSALGTGELAIGGASSPTISSDSSGASGARTFANAVTVQGDVTFGDGTSDGAMLFASSANLGNTGDSRVFTVNAKTTFAGFVSGGASLTKAGNGVLTLSGSNSYSGGTTFASGMTLAGTDNSFGTGALTFAGGSIGSADSTPHTFTNAVVFLGDLTVGDYIDSIGALTFTSQLDLGNANRRITTKANATFSGAITNGAITKDGLGSLTLTGTNTYDGGTTLTEGALFAGTDQAFGTGILNLNGGIIGSAGGRRSFLNTVSMAGGTVQFGDAEHLSALSFAGDTQLAAGQHTFNTIADTTFTGVISGDNASLTKAGGGVLTLTGVNTFDGGTRLEAGSVRIANDFSLGGGAITFAGGAIASATNETRAIHNNVAFNGGATIGDGSSNGAFVFLGANNALSAGAQTITTNVATTFVNGISGGGGLTKSGASTLTLKGANTYAGDTVVEAGKLVLDGSLVGSPTIHLAAGAVLGGHGRFDGTISGFGSVDPGNSPGVLTVGSVNPSNGMSFNFEFTQLGSPTWSNTAASGNDVLLIKDGPAFTASLTSANTVNIYFSSAVTSHFTAFSSVTLQGGFFSVDQTHSLASAIVGANYNFYFQTGTAGGISYNGNYYLTETQARSQGLLPNGGQGFIVRQATVASANFDATATGVGTTGGLTMEIVSSPIRNGSGFEVVAVPEPSTWAMGLMAAAGVALTRRRRLARVLGGLRTALRR